MGVKLQPRDRFQGVELGGSRREASNAPRREAVRTAARRFGAFWRGRLRLSVVG